MAVNRSPGAEPKEAPTLKGDAETELGRKPTCLGKRREMLVVTLFPSRHLPLPIRAYETAYAAADYLDLGAPLPRVQISTFLLIS